MLSMQNQYRIRDNSIRHARLVFREPDNLRAPTGLRAEAAEVGANPDQPFRADGSRYADQIRAFVFSPQAPKEIQDPKTWLTPDLKEDGVTPAESASAKIERIYAALFGETSQLRAQVPAGTSVEKAVFGSESGADLALKTKRLSEWSRKIFEQQELAVRSKESLDELNKNTVVEACKTGVDNLVDAFKSGDGMDKAIMAVGGFFAAKMLWNVVFNWDEFSKKSGAGQIFTVLPGLAGIGFLASQATGYRFDLTDFTRLTSPLDQLQGTPHLEKLAKSLSFRDAPSVFALARLGNAPIGTMFEKYEAAWKSDNPKNRKINLRELTGTPGSERVTDRDGFDVAHAVFEKYGSKYFKMVSGREPDGIYEKQLGAKFFVEYWRAQGAEPTLDKVVLGEESGNQPSIDTVARWVDSNGALKRAAGSILALPGVIHDPNNIERVTAGNIQWALEQIGFDPKIYDREHPDRFTTFVTEKYKTWTPAAQEQFKKGMAFMRRNYAEFREDPEKFLTQVRDDSVEFTMRVARETGAAVQPELKFVWDANKAAFKVFIQEPGQQLQEVADQFLAEQLADGSSFMNTPILPYRYDIQRDEWMRATPEDIRQFAMKVGRGTWDANIAALNRAGEVAADGAKYASIAAEIGLANSRLVVQTAWEAAGHTWSDTWRPQFDLAWSKEFVPFAYNNQERLINLVRSNPGEKANFDLIYRSNRAMIQIFTEAMAERKAELDSGVPFAGGDLQASFERILREYETGQRAIP